jgi:hypothetical protein
MVDKGQVLNIEGGQLLFLHWYLAASLLLELVAVMLMLSSGEAAELALPIQISGV